MVVSLNIDFLKRAYFYTDLPVEYTLRNKEKIMIYPVKIKDSEIFLSSCGILSIDKNSMSDVKIIQMSYLQFLVEKMLSDKINQQRLLNIFILCLNKNRLNIFFDDNEKPYIKDMDSQIIIGPKDFEDIRRIILYQNILNFDDEYINPDIKKAIEEQNELTNKNIEDISLERKIAIISSHTGISKKEQLEMTLRSHSLLFEEVCGEVEFMSIRSVALFSGKEINHWIYKKKKNKFDEYITDIDTYQNNIGGNNSIIKSSNTRLGDGYMSQFENFNQ